MPRADPGRESPAAPFDRRLIRLRRERRLAAPDFASFLHEEIAGRLMERLADIRRLFADILELGAGPGSLSRRLAGRPGVRHYVCADLAMAGRRRASGAFVQADEELLPFAPASFDAVISAGGLHLVNDLPGTLVQIRALLRPDGLFLAAFFGGATLQELREVLLLAELELRGGAVPRVAPMVDLADAASLLQRAGFALPVADLDRITVLYRDPAGLLDDLRRMAETGAPRLAGGAPLRRDVLARALELYRQRHAGPDGRVAATFELVWMTGWRPHPSQPRPRPRGSGTIDLARWLGEQGRAD